MRAQAAFAKAVAMGDLSEHAEFDPVFRMVPCARFAGREVNAEVLCSHSSSRAGVCVRDGASGTPGACISTALGPWAQVRST